MANQRIGGNTACVVVTGDGFGPIVLDLGTGLRFWGEDLGAPRPTITGFAGPADDRAPFAATALVSHLHWDHIQGLPFFQPMHDPTSHLHIVGPRQEGGMSLGEAFDTFLCPPVFPVTLSQLRASVSFEEARDGSVTHVGAATITSREVPHVGPTLGYRIEAGGRSIAYVSDHQQPGCGATDVAPAVLELCDGVDLLIHDAQYTDVEFAERFDWGHCTVDYAVEVAAQAGVRRLALYHHDPAHDDDQVDHLTGRAAATSSSRGGPEVFAAAEGLVVDL